MELAVENTKKSQDFFNEYEAVATVTPDPNAEALAIAQKTFKELETSNAKFETNLINVVDFLLENDALLLDFGQSTITVPHFETIRTNSETIGKIRNPEIAEKQKIIDALVLNTDLESTTRNQITTDYLDNTVPIVEYANNIKGVIGINYKTFSNAVRTAYKPVHNGKKVTEEAAITFVAQTRAFQALKNDASLDSMTVVAPSDAIKNALGDLIPKLTAAKNEIASVTEKSPFANVAGISSPLVAYSTTINDQLDKIKITTNEVASFVASVTNNVNSGDAAEIAKEGTKITIAFNSAETSAQKIKEIVGLLQGLAPSNTELATETTAFLSTLTTKMDNLTAIKTTFDPAKITNIGFAKIEANNAEGILADINGLLRDVEETDRKFREAQAAEKAAEKEAAKALKAAEEAAALKAADETAAKKAAEEFNTKFKELLDARTKITDAASDTFKAATDLLVTELHKVRAAQELYKLCKAFKMEMSDLYPNSTSPEDYEQTIRDKHKDAFVAYNDLYAETAWKENLTKFLTNSNVTPDVHQSKIKTLGIYITDAAKLQSNFLADLNTKIDDKSMNDWTDKYKLITGQISQINEDATQPYVEAYANINTTSEDVCVQTVIHHLQSIIADSPTPENYASMFQIDPVQFGKEFVNFKDKFYFQHMKTIITSMSADNSDQQKHLMSKLSDDNIIKRNDGGPINTFVTPSASDITQVNDGASTYNSPVKASPGQLQKKLEDESIRPGINTVLKLHKLDLTNLGDISATVRAWRLYFVNAFGFKNEGTIERGYKYKAFRWSYRIIPKQENVVELPKIQGPLTQKKGLDYLKTCYQLFISFVENAEALVLFGKSDAITKQTEDPNIFCNFNSTFTLPFVRSYEGKFNNPVGLYLFSVFWGSKDALIMNEKGKYWTGSYFMCCKLFHQQLIKNSLNASPSTVNAIHRQFTNNLNSTVQTVLNAKHDKLKVNQIDTFPKQKFVTSYFGSAVLKVNINLLETKNDELNGTAESTVLLNNLTLYKTDDDVPTGIEWKTKGRGQGIDVFKGVFLDTEDIDNTLTKPFKDW